MRTNFLQKWGLLAAKSARKGRFRRPKSGCPITCFITQNYFWLISEGHLPTKMGVAGCKECPERPLSAPEVWLPNHVIQHPEFCANTWCPTPYKNGSYWLRKRPGEGAQKGRFRHPKSGWPVAQHPDICASILRRALCLFLAPQPIVQIVGCAGCKKSQRRVPEKAIFGTPSLASQSHDSELRNLRPF